ncbi:hypothetical protein [Streptomyces sp. NPDC054783]
MPAVRRASRRGDRLTLPVPLPALVRPAGLTATASSVTNPYGYRLGVGVRFRSVFTLDPDVPAMAHGLLVQTSSTAPGGGAGARAAVMDR